MKKYLLATAVVLIAVCLGVSYAATRSSASSETESSELRHIYLGNKSEAGKPPKKLATSHITPSGIWCANIIVSFPSDHPGPYVTQGTTLTAGSDGSSCQGTIIGYIWKRNGTAISGATASTYTTTSADAGATITVRVTGTIQSQDSINSAKVLGSALLDDEFDAASGTHPGGTGDVCTGSACTWYERTDVTGFENFDGWNGIVESGSGFLELQAWFADADGDGDTSATNTDATSDGTDVTNSDWKSSFLQSANMTGSRYAEADIHYPCTDNDTGWTTAQGWEYAAYQGAGYGSTPTEEADFFGSGSKTTWGATTVGGNPDADGDNDTSGESDSAPADYLISNGALQTFQMTGSFDGDHDGDSVSSDTDSPSVPPDPDESGGSDGDEAAVAEGTHGDVWNLVSPGAASESQTTKICGTWHTYGALILPHEVDFYFDGQLNYTAYTGSGTSPNPRTIGYLGLSSSFDLTTVPLKQVFSLEGYQAPPQGAATTYMDIQYVRVYALS